MLQMRAFDDPDWAQIWPILRDIVVEQETFPYDPAMTEDKARSMWVTPHRDAPWWPTPTVRSWAPPTCTRTDLVRAST